jgi:hypothetical protein
MPMIGKATTVPLELSREIATHLTLSRSQQGHNVKPLPY